MGAWSFSPSPITTTPRIRTVSSTTRIASTAAPSADSFSPRPIQRAAAIAPASVTRTSSSAMFRSGTCFLFTSYPTPVSHALWRLDPDQVETARDHPLSRAAEREPERLLVAFQYAVLVVEAVKVVGNADRVLRDRLRATLLGRVGGNRGQLGQALDQLPLLRSERSGEIRRERRVACVAEDPRDTCVRVLHVVDRILLRFLRRKIDVDLDRLIGPAFDEIPARRVDADLVHEVVQEDDVATPLGHLRLFAASRQVNELVQKHLDA